MNRLLMFAMAASALALVAPGVMLNRRLRRETILAQRVRAVQSIVGLEAVATSGSASRSRLLRAVVSLGEAITKAGLLSASALDDLERRLSIAGFRGHGMLSLFVGAKLLSLAGLPLLGWLLIGHSGWSLSIRFATIAGAGMVGLLLPDFVIRRLHRRHLQAVERGLPDALDMLVICSEAGLGLDPAIERVSREIATAHPAVAEELMNLVRDMRVNADRRAALVNLGVRTGLKSLRRLGVTLVQTLQYGTPLSQALRTLSAEMRQEALTRFETRASRLPTLLTVPMIVFILPCVFLIVGGPAVVHILQVMLQ
jgi:tight adherence protein C